MRALVIDHGASRSALAGSRALASAGWRVGIGSPCPSLATASRSSTAWHLVPPPEDALGPFVEAVDAAVAAGGYEVVLGSDDQHMLALSLCRSELSASVGYPEHPALLRAIDKLELLRAAEGVGLATPDTEEASAEALERFEPPVVVKARVHSGFEAGSARAYLEPTVAHSRDDAERYADWIRQRGGAPIFQRVVQGQLMAYSLVADADANVVAAVQQQSERIWPPGAGISARARTVAEDPELAARAQQLVRELGWFGLAELQFIREPGRPPLLIDLNGRFYGSLSLATAAGVNLPAAWAAVATGRQPPVRRPGREGVRYQWLEGDLRLALRDHDGGKLRSIAGTLAYAASASHSVLDLRDPRPGLRYARDLARRALTSRPTTGEGE